MIPLTSINAKIEFRILYNVFFEHYKIRRKAFSFDDYVNRMYEKMLLQVITIRPVDWLLVCIIVLLNWARVELGNIFTHIRV